MSAICSNPDCDFAQSGSCVDGFDPVERCPTMELSIADAETDELTSSIEPHFEIGEAKADFVESDMVEVSSGTALSTLNATKVLRQHGAKVIACIGPSAVGKTTLLASMYECLNANNLAPYFFAGSKTLFAFESICHMARAVSRADVADTARTPRTGDVNFYHLVFSSLDNRQDMLFADRAGEEYEALLDSSDEYDSLFEVSRADVIMVLVDASTLIGNKRHSVKRNLLNLIKIMHEKNMLEEGSTIFLVLTRYDLTEKEANRGGVNDMYDQIFNQVVGILANKGIAVEKQIVAARPASLDEFEAGHGVIELLAKLIKSSSKTSMALEFDSGSGSLQSPRIFHQLKSEF